MNKKWECYNNNIEEVQKIAKNFNVSNLLATILSNKNISSENEIEKFLNPTRNDFYDPFLMPDMKIAVDRILEAMSKKEKIIIYGDYDVDGITSITVLKQFLEDRGIEVGQYIPNRLNEGYGLNKKAIEEIVKQKYTLMITVDCGISGVEEVEYANSLGIETIITDHHEQGEEIPNALAVVDAKRKDNKYPFNQLAGVGVVFKLIQALGICLGLEEKEYLKYLDLVCVGTISDIVPLVDENRVIAKLGLKLVQVTKNIGLKTLLDTVGYKKIDSITISFGVAPRINACGRMGFQNEALDLFLTKSEKEAKEISDRLNEYNRERQDTEKKIFSEALQKIEKSEKDKPCIILGSENWHHGVIGIVASKVTDMYFKPSILICFEDGIGKGSGRSVPGFDLHEALSKCDKYVEKFGGHSMAIGITVTQDNFNKFKEEFEEYTKNSDIDKIVPIIYIDQEVTLKDINLKAAKELQLLEPFGEGNKMPLFLYKNLRIDSIRALSEGKHLKLTLKDDNYIIDAIGFNMGALADEYLIGDKIDVVGTLEINSFNNVEKIQINLKDVRKSY
ncbi:exonuclease RecJ [Clostridium sp. CAG:571]|jgi:single-stranded-DNA-specific exonuclease|nr:exonuclease RecJ [Clostridium sp. CAG:571]HJJ07055.1 single-stranded-DNA-specific exonuclease RecJ [Clostridiaceae bacterium]